MGHPKLQAVVVAVVLLLVIHTFLWRSTPTPERTYPLFASQTPLQSVNNTHPPYLARILLDAVLKGGKLVKYIRENENLVTSSKSSGGGKREIVSNADKRSHDIMKKVLSPHLPLVSEEATNPTGPLALHYVYSESYDPLANPSKYVAWIDPLDATWEYATGQLPSVSVMACAVDTATGRPVVGAIFAPYRSDYVVYLAIKGKAYKIHRSSIEDGHITLHSLNHHHAKLADTIEPDHTSETHGWVDKLLYFLRERGDHRKNFKGLRGVISQTPLHAAESKQMLKRLQMDDKDILTAGGAGNKVLSLLEGLQDVYLNLSPIRKWDICAGDALLEAAGGLMVDSTGNTLSYSLNSPVYVQGGIAAVIAPQTT